MDGRFDQDKVFDYQLGFWSATIVTLLLVVSGVASSGSIQIPSLVAGLLLTPKFIVVMACIHYCAPDDKKVLSEVGLSCALVYATLTSIDCYMQLIFVRQGSFNVEIFAMDNPQSIMCPPFVRCTNVLLPIISDFSLITQLVIRMKGDQAI